MKRNLSDALIPALTAFKTGLVDVEEALVWLGDGLATAIKYITLFVEDVVSAYTDLQNLDFSNIGQQFADNVQSAFYSTSTAADQAATSTNNLSSSTDGLNDKQKALGKTLQANTMSFDQLHNISDSAGGDGGAGAGGTPKAPKIPRIPNISTNNKSKGIVIPVSFKVPPVPPIPPIPPVPPVVFPALDLISPVLAFIKKEIGALPKLINVPVSLMGEAILLAALAAMKNKIAEWEVDATKCFDTVSETVSGWETSAVKAFNDVQITIDGWETDAVIAFGLFSTALASSFEEGFNAASETVHGWQVAASSDFSTFASNAVTAMTTFGTRFQSAWSTALGATETMVEGWATTIEKAFTSAVSGAMQSIGSLATAAGQTIANAGSSLGDWASNNKALLAGAGIAGPTVATGGADLAIAGIASAADALAGIGAGFGTAALAGVTKFATGGIATSATLGVFGEAAPEAIIPLSQLDTMLSSAAKSTPNNSNNATAQPINLTVQLDGRTLAIALYQYTTNEADRLGKTIGYNMSYNYPK